MCFYFNCKNWWERCQWLKVFFLIFRATAPTKLRYKTARLPADTKCHSVVSKELLLGEGIAAFAPRPWTLHQGYQEKGQPQHDMTVVSAMCFIHVMVFVHVLLFREALENFFFQLTGPSLLSDRSRWKPCSFPGPFLLSHPTVVIQDGSGGTNKF